jgi:hypothetical protein
MSVLDPGPLFRRIAADIPQELHSHLFIVGSLAAAYHYRSVLHRRGVNTKDADLMIHPAGDTLSCGQMAMRLLDVGWTRIDGCYRSPSPIPANALRAIRLSPPDSADYFVEFLNIPVVEQVEDKRWIPVELPDGWYALPSFKFMGLLAINRYKSEAGLDYADPAMMALANLLSHPELGATRIESGEMQGLLRAAKDLGRVIALVRLAGEEEIDHWGRRWPLALRDRFPNSWQNLLSSLGTGLEELLGDDNAMEEARQTTEVGLLSGLGVTGEMLRASGERLLEEVILPLRKNAD